VLLLVALSMAAVSAGRLALMEAIKPYSMAVARSRRDVGVVVVVAGPGVDDDGVNALRADGGGHALGESTALPTGA